MEGWVGVGRYCWRHWHEERCSRGHFLDREVFSLVYQSLGRSWEQEDDFESDPFDIGYERNHRFAESLLNDLRSTERRPNDETLMCKYRAHLSGFLEREEAHASCPCLLPLPPAPLAKCADKKNLTCRLSFGGGMSLRGVDDGWRLRFSLVQLLCVSE